MSEKQKKVDIFALASPARESEGEDDSLKKAVNKITDNGKNMSALFVSEEEEAIAKGKAQLDMVMNMSGGKVIDEQGKDTGYRTEKQKEDEISRNKLKSILDVPEPEKELEIAPVALQASKNDILEAALEWIGDGKSVIPVGKNKMPLISWKEFHTRIASVEEVKGWWEKWPDAQLGLVTGKISQISVVDIEKEFGDYKKLGLPETTISRTGSGGYHLFYEHVEGVRNKAKIKDSDGIVQEIDIRGEGGYVIIPPSSNENGAYNWHKKVDNIPGFPVDRFPLEKPVDSSGNFEKTIDYDVRDYPGFGAGQRNNEMTRYIGAVMARTSMDLWDTMVWEHVQQANLKNDPPLNDNELQITFDSISKAEGPKSLEKWHEKLERDQKDERADMLDAIEGDDIVTLTEAAEKIRELNPQTYPTGFASLDGAMRGGFKEGDLIVVSGMSGHGKTTLGQTFTYNMIENDLPVLWFSYEVSADILDEKFQAMGVKKDYKVYVPEVTATGDMLWVTKKIEEAIKKVNIKIVFVDLIDFLSPIKNKPSDSEALVLKRVTEELKNIARKERIIMIVMAHVRKQKDTKKGLENQDIAHSSSIVQLSDYVIMIERIPEKASRKAEETTDHLTGAILESRKHIVYGSESEIRITKNRYTGVLITERCLLGDDKRFKTIAPSVNRPAEPKKQGYYHDN